MNSHNLTTGDIIPSSLELVGEPEVVELPGVGGQVEDVVLGALAEAAVARGEQPLQRHRLAVLEGRAHHVAAQRDRRPRGACRRRNRSMCS